jgi:hypothetical protein
VRHDQRRGDVGAAHTGYNTEKDGTGEIIYSPPDGEALLREMLANWESYLRNETDISSRSILLLMATDVRGQY